MELIQWVTSILAIVVLVISFLRIRLNPEKKFIRVPLIFLMGHVVLFYVFVLLNHYDVIQYGDFSSWSSILRLHSVLTYLVLEVYGWRRDKLWKNLH